MKRLLILVLMLLFAASTLHAGSSFRSSGSSFRSSPTKSFSSWSSKPSSSKSATPSKPSNWSWNNKPKSVNAAAQQKTASIDKAKSREAYDQYQRSQRQFQKPASKVSQQKAKFWTPANYKYNPERRASQSQMFYSSRHYEPPAVIHQMAPSYGVFDNIALFYMLSHMNQPDYAMMAYSNRDSEDMKKWRADTEAAAKDNAELRAQLTALDAKMTEIDKSANGLGVEKNYIPKEMGLLAISDAVLKQASKEESGWSKFWKVSAIIAVGAIMLFLILGRRWSV